MIRAVIVVLLFGLTACAANQSPQLVVPAATPAEGVAVRFIITRESSVSGGGDRKTYENSVLMASGNTFNGNFDPMSRVKLYATDQGANIHVLFELHDSMRGVVLVGSTTADVP